MNLYLRIAKFWYENPQGFYVEQLKNELVPDDKENILLDKHFNDAYQLYKNVNHSAFETPFFLFEPHPQAMNNPSIELNLK